MFTGRAQELKFLEECYRKPESQILVLYGREGIGKTELVRQFVKDKSYRYSYLEECSGQEQFLRLSAEWGTDGGEPDFAGFFTRLAQQDSLQGRRIWILDEFQHGIRSDSGFTEGLSALAEGQEEYFLILISSSVNWVENGMVRALGPLALRITSFLKLREWGFLDLVARFPNFRLEDCIQTYAVTDGVPGYLADWDGRKSFRDNVTELFLKKNGKLYGEAPRFLKEELRELSLYHTILAALASGATKLNDIREYTGFGRAKISVYLKNLIELDIVEKVFSYDAPGKENTRKGVYRIRDFYMLFYYRYLFPNRSLLELAGDSPEETERLYGQILEGKIEALWGDCFKKVCTEYLQLMDQHGRLPVHVSRSGGWFGKRGDIDYLAEDEEGHLLAAFFLWQEEAVGIEQKEELMERLTEAGVHPDHIYLFARRGFTEELQAAKGDMVLRALEEM